MCVLPRCVLGAHGGQERILIPGPGVAEGSELQVSTVKQTESSRRAANSLRHNLFLQPPALSSDIPHVLSSTRFPDPDRPGQMYVPFKEELSVVKYSLHLEQ